MKGIYFYSQTVGRGGDLEGLFIADSTDVANAIGETIELGEVCGKHSDVSIVLEQEDIVLKNSGRKVVEIFETVLGEDFSFGTNPINVYLNQVSDQTDEDEVESNTEDGGETSED